MVPSLTLSIGSSHFPLLSIFLGSYTLASQLLFIIMIPSVHIHFPLFIFLKYTNTIIILLQATNLYLHILTAISADCPICKCKVELNLSNI